MPVRLSVLSLTASTGIAAAVSVFTRSNTRRYSRRFAWILYDAQGTALVENERVHCFWPVGHSWIRRGENWMFPQINSNGPVRFGLVSILCLGAVLYFDRKPERQAVAVLSIVLSTSLCSFLWQWMRAHLARKWVRVEAQLESGALTQIRTRRECRYRVQVSYSYSMEDSYYGGFYETYFRNEPEATQFLHHLRRKCFWIRVNPAARDQSLVIPEEL